MSQFIARQNYYTSGARCTFYPSQLPVSILRPRKKSRRSIVSPLLWFSVQRNFFQSSSHSVDTNVDSDNRHDKRFGLDSIYQNRERSTLERGHPHHPSDFYPWPNYSAVMLHVTFTPSRPVAQRRCVCFAAQHRRLWPWFADACEEPPAAQRGCGYGNGWRRGCCLCRWQKWECDFLAPVERNGTTVLWCSMPHGPFTSLEVFSERWLAGCDYQVDLVKVREAFRCVSGLSRYKIICDYPYMPCTCSASRCKLPNTAEQTRDMRRSATLQLFSLTFNGVCLLSCLESASVTGSSGWSGRAERYSVRVSASKTIILIQ